MKTLVIALVVVLAPSVAYADFYLVLIRLSASGQVAVVMPDRYPTRATCNTAANQDWTNGDEYIHRCVRSP
jgi:hypothetical protein